MVTEIFGDLLFTSKSERYPEFPSPEVLKKRIIISTKPPKEYLESKNVKVVPNQNQKGSSLLEENGWGTEVDIKATFEELYKVCYILGIHISLVTSTSLLHD